MPKTDPIIQSPASSDYGMEVSILKEYGQGVEVQHLQSYGIGIDCHSRFIAVCVHVRRDNHVYKYQKISIQTGKASWKQKSGPYLL